MEHNARQIWIASSTIFFVFNNLSPTCPQNCTFWASKNQRERMFDCVMGEGAWRCEPNLQITPGPGRLLLPNRRSLALARPTADNEKKRSQSDTSFRLLPPVRWPGRTGNRVLDTLGTPATAWHRVFHFHFASANVTETYRGRDCVNGAKPTVAPRQRAACQSRLVRTNLLRKCGSHSRQPEPGLGSSNSSHPPPAPESQTIE